MTSAFDLADFSFTVFVPAPVPVPALTPALARIPVPVAFPAILHSIEFAPFVRLFVRPISVSNDESLLDPFDPTITESPD